MYFDNTESASDRKGYAILLRTYVSKNIAETGRAVLEHLRLSHERIKMCYRTHQDQLQIVQLREA